MTPGFHADGSPDERFGADVVGVNGMTLAHVLGNIERQFTLGRKQLVAITDRFCEAMDYGLNHQGSQMAMIPSFVTRLPQGDENGTYLAMDLGGTNLRVCAVTLQGQGRVSIKQEKYKVQDNLKQGPVADLFAYMAESVDVFLNDYGTEIDEGEDYLSMGFTFSFPVQQTSIDSGTLISWTKGFNCPDAIGKDMVKLLQQALDKRHLKVRVEALINDTVGTLLTSAYQQGGSLLGAIFGTGTNGAYLESLDAIGKIEVQKGNSSSCNGSSAPPNGSSSAAAAASSSSSSSAPAPSAPTHMIVNTEWGSFDNARKTLPVTQYDNKVDRTAIRQRHHIFEKMISGMYLGEIFRSVLVNMIDQLLLFDGFAADSLNNKYELETYIMSLIEEDIDAGLPADDPANKTRHVLIHKLGVPEEYVQPKDVETVRKVCQWVGTRAARLSATAIAATIIHTGHAQPIEDSSSSAQAHAQGKAQAFTGSLNIGADGSLVELYPHFRERIHQALVEILGRETADRVSIQLAKDGSGVGAALSALAAKKQRALGHNVKPK